MDSLAAAVVPSVIAGVCAIVGAAIGASEFPMGWARRAARMIDLYERLPEDGLPRATEALAKRMLRQKIYDQVYFGLGCRMDDGVPVPRDRVWPSVRDAIAQNASALLGSLLILGVPDSPEKWCLLVVGLALGWFVTTLAGRILSAWPATDRNPLYRAARKRAERRRRAREDIRIALEKFDEWAIAGYAPQADSTERKTA